MPETIIESVLLGKINHEVLVKWLNDEVIEDSPEYGALLCCSRSEFVVYFLSFIRNQTDSILQTNANALSLIHQGTPEKILNSRRKHRRSVSEPTSELENDRSSDTNLTVKTDRNRSHESPSRERSNQKKTGRRVKTKLFNESEKSNDQSSSFLSSKADSDESRISTGVEKLLTSSTPLKNGIGGTDYPNLSFSSPVTPHSRSFGNFERCDTPRINQRHSKSQEKSSFGDYLVNAQVKSSKKKRVIPKNVSKEAEDTKTGIDLSSSEMFPEIGARKSNSLRSEKRRIKPTNLDNSTPQKSFSLNSFNSESFQQPSSLAMQENQAFKQQNVQTKESSNTFDMERNILKQERHKLMEKFNILNVSATQTSPTVQIKITRRESTEHPQTFVTADVNKIIFKEKIDNLVETYIILLRNNYILSMSTEIYFLISILLSKQDEDSYLEITSKINEDNATESILKTIHNCTYFAVKSLWHQRNILEFILDKNSLRILGENKKVRSFYPDLAKFLLNLYGMKSESDTVKDEKSVIVLDNRYSNGMVCFNFETDNADNFPSLLSFQNFKKQRDMFYEILRWYNDSQHSAGSKATFRTRVKTLLSLAIAASNHAHLARLFTKHMMAECLPSSQQESKLSKLQRRLTCPSSHESNRLPRFSNKEMFYKEFMMFAENESFRAHLRDCLSSEIVTLNSATLGSPEERGNSSNPDVAKEYLNLLKKLTLLSKFLGYLTALPYVQVPTEYTIKTRSVQTYEQKEQNFTPPKDKVLENYLDLRNYSQPTLDLKTILVEANQNGRLSITLPWLSQYIAMLDYSSLRTRYYEDLLKYILEIYFKRLKVDKENFIKRNTLIFLNITLGWLFDLPHFPQEIFYERTLSDSSVRDIARSSEDNIDSLDIIDESILYEACPFLKDISVLLLTSKPTQEVKDAGTFRHITPVSIVLNTEDRMRNKEKEIQARLEEEYLKSLPMSTRRVLELVAERVGAHCVRQLPALAADARSVCRARLAAALPRHAHSDPLPIATQIYTTSLESLRANALEMCQKLSVSRCRVALQALLSTGGRALTHVAAKACMAKLTRWLADHWTGIHILCKDIPAEIQALQLLADSATKEEDTTQSYNTDSLMLPAEQFDVINVSPNNVIIDIKEQICLLLEHKEPSMELAPLLSLAAGASSAENVLTRVPTRRALLHLTADLCLVLVSRRPKEVTDELLAKFDSVWNECCPDRERRVEPMIEEREGSPELRNFDEDDRAPTPISDDETTKNPIKFIYPPSSPKSTKTQKPLTTAYPKNLTSPTVSGQLSPNLKGQLSPNLKGQLSPNLKSQFSPNLEVKQAYHEYFNRILCPRNIVLLSTSKCDKSVVWQTMAKVLVYLMGNDYLSEDSLTEQCLAIYRQDWPQTTLESLAVCMRSVCDNTRSSTTKLTLFLQFLAEYSLDMD